MDVVSVGGPGSAGEPAAGVVEPAGDGAVDDVVADLDAHAAEDVGVDDDVEVHRSRRTGGRAPARAAARRSSPSGRATRTVASARPALGGDVLGSPPAPRRPCGRSLATRLLDQREGGREHLAVEQRVEQRCLVVGRAAGSDSASRSSRVARRRCRPTREQLVLDLVGLGSGRADRRAITPSPRAVGQVARGASSAGRPRP